MREAGIPLETFNVKDSAGQTIAAYRFGDLSMIDRSKLEGRRTFSRKLKAELLAAQDNRCAICHTRYAGRYLQIDHRIPYEVLGDDPTSPPDTNDYMLLCASCNRAKARSCETCENGQHLKDPTVCQSCYWAHPTNYQHIATRPIRRVVLTWEADEVQQVEQWMREAEAIGLSLQDYLKRKLRNHRDDTTE